MANDFAFADYMYSLKDKHPTGAVWIVHPEFAKYLYWLDTPEVKKQLRPVRKYYRIADKLPKKRKYKHGGRLPKRGKK